MQNYTPLKVIFLLLPGILLLSQAHLLMARPYQGRPLLPADTTIKEPTLTVDLSTSGDVSIEAASQEGFSFKGGRDKNSVKDTLVYHDKVGKQERLFTLPEGMIEEGKSHEKLQVSLPKGNHLRLRAHQGALNLSGLKGDIFATVEEGPVSLSGLEGFLFISTQKGDITASNLSAGGSLQTNEGNIWIENPSQALQAFTRQGVITTKITSAYFQEKSQKVIRLGMQEGNFEIDLAPKGAFVVTRKGNILVSSAQDSLMAYSEEGNIQIKSVQGAVYAGTDAGNVSLTFTGPLTANKESIEVHAVKGDITLYLPAGLSATFFIDQEQSDEKKGTYRISSDFPLGNLSQEPVYDERKKLTMYKTLAEKGVSGGKCAIRIRAINGNITIKKNQL